MKSTLISVALMVFVQSGALYAQELKPITLLPPQLTIGKPLMQTLNERRSQREFSSRKLPIQELSNLLWAACGVNRPEKDNRRTAPTAVNWQEIEVYAALEEGLYRYNAIGHILEPVLADDLRAATGKQDFVAGAPLNLVYVSDQSKMGDASQESKDLYSATDTGFVSQNVYLYCASQGLATVVRGWVDIPALEKLMKLRPDHKVILAQTVGYPKD